MMLPQQPLHKCLLPNASRYTSFSAATNPFQCDLGGFRLLGHSGQPINDMIRYCVGAPDDRSKAELDALQRTLEWSHIAPSAPDTLPAYPSVTSDPFVLNEGECPHVLFAGNQTAYATRVVGGSAGQEVRLLTLPSFGATGIAVLLNLATCEPHPIRFSTE